MVSEDLSQRLRRMASPEWVEKPARDLLLEAADALDASVHAGSYRQELLLEIADSFRSAPDVLECEDMALFAMETRARIRREIIEEVAAGLEMHGYQTGAAFAAMLREQAGIPATLTPDDALRDAVRKAINAGLSAREARLVVARVTDDWHEDVCRGMAVEVPDGQ